MAIASWELLVNNNEGFHCRRLARLLKFLFCLSKENEKQIGQNFCGIYSKQWEYFSKLCTFFLYSKMSLEFRIYGKKVNRYMKLHIHAACSLRI